MNLRYLSKVCTLVVYGLSVQPVSTYATDWGALPVPAEAGIGKAWELQDNASDDFNYSFAAASAWSYFGAGNKWYNFYHNGWNGPGTTYWQYDHVSVDGSDLIIRSSRNPSTAKMGVPGVNAGCITSGNRVLYPAYVEASVSVADITLASDFWLLSADDTQEIDVIECYGGAYQGNSYFAKFIHVSHHSFVRNPFTDYQPRDKLSWWSKSGVNSWGQYCWNGGDRRYVRVGVNWLGPKHFEYYVDGQRVRVLYDKALANKVNDQWEYAYPTMTGGVLDFSGGYQALTQHSISGEYSFSNLQAASAASSVSIIDPYGYQGTAGFTKEMDIIVNVESQDWHVDAGRTPSDADLLDPAKNTMKVDWIRVYKLVDIEPAAGGPVLGISIEDSLAVINVTNGASNANFNLLGNENLTNNAGWAVVASNLMFDALGVAIVSNTLDGASQFFFKVEEGVTSPSGTAATFDWEETTGSGLNKWNTGYNYSETDHGVTMTHGGRATTGDGKPHAIKFAYDPQDLNPATFTMEYGGSAVNFIVTSIDISQDTGTTSGTEKYVRGMLGTTVQWEIIAPENDSMATYTTATSGDLGLAIDTIEWQAGWVDGAGNGLESTIDNLAILISTP